MKKEFTITVTIKLDAREHHEVDNSPEGVVELVRAMIDGQADFPELVTVTCEHVTEEHQLGSMVI